MGMRERERERERERKREREREREKKYPIMLSFKHHNFVMPKHTEVIHDWQVLVLRWLFMLFS